jgi:hypothetical protein
MVTVTAHEHCIRIVASELAGPAVDAIERVYAVDGSVASQETSSGHPRPDPCPDASEAAGDRSGA